MTTRAIIHDVRIKAICKDLRAQEAILRRIYGQTPDDEGIRNAIDALRAARRALDADDQ